MRLLVTGFPPFPGRPVNPSQLLVRDVQQGGFSLPGVQVFAGLVPVEYRAVEREFNQLVKTHRPDVVLSFGVGRQRALLRLEQCGANLDDCPVADNAGQVRQGKVISTRDPEVLCSPFKLTSLRDQLRSKRLTADLSDNAGRYLCNHLLFHGLKMSQRSQRPFRFQFVHVSARSSQNHQKRLLAALHIIAAWFQNQD